MKNKLNYFILSISVFLLFMFAGNIFNSNSTNELFLGDTYLLGDVDGNGKVGASDYILVKKHILMLSTLNADRIKRADVNGDGKINSLDYIRIKKIILSGERIEVTPVPTVKPTQVPIVTTMPTTPPTTVPTSTAIPTSTPAPSPTLAPQVKGKIHFIYVGDGDSIIIEMDGHYGIMDGGYVYEDEKKLHSDIISPASYLNSIGATHLDFIINSHPDIDHIGGLIDLASTSFVDSSTKFYYHQPTEGVGLLDTMINKLNQKHVQLFNMADDKVASANKKFKLGSSSNYFDIELMNLNKRASNEGTGNLNKDSIVAYVTYKGKHGTLLTGDLESQDEYRMADNNEFSGKSVDVLKIAHHGWQSSTTMKFVKIKEIHPKVAIITNSVVLDDISTSIYYLQTKYDTKFYLTGDNRSNESIIIEYGDDISVSTRKSSIVKAVSKYTATVSSNWGKLQNGIYFYMTNTNDIDTIVYDRFIQYNDAWYYLGIGGNMMTGWVEIKYNNKVDLYYFGSDGKMVTGWCQAKSISPYNNNLTDSYYKYNMWMYSHENNTIPAGWYEYSDGWANGKNWFYFNPSGAMVYGTCLTIGDEKFCFNSSGVCYSGRGC